MTQQTTTSKAATNFDTDHIRDEMRLAHDQTRYFMAMAREPNDRTDVQYCLAMARTNSRKYTRLLRTLEKSGTYIDWTRYRWNEYIDKYGMPN